MNRDTVILAAFIITVLFICKALNTLTQHPKPLAMEQRDEMPDTTKPVITTAFTGKTHPIIFEAAFVHGTQVVVGEWQYTFHKDSLGKINIESGKLIACDPPFCFDQKAFTQVFPIGQFPVQLAMAKTDDDERVAFSRILFSKKPVEKWEFALKPGQKPLPLTDTSYYCYGVDTGTGSFMDSLTAKAVNTADEATVDNIFESSDGWNEHQGSIQKINGHDLAIFRSGYGDGCYSTYIGFDKNGNVCQLLTDFGLVEWWKL